MRFPIALLLMAAGPVAASLVAAGLAVDGAAHAETLAPAAIVRGESETSRVDCGGAPAEIQGNRNTLTFTGACRGLTLRGEANRVSIDLAPNARIDIQGNGNELRYTQGAAAAPPSVSVSGHDNDIQPTR